MVPSIHPPPPAARPNDGAAAPAAQTPETEPRLRRRVLFITFDSIGARLGGSAIRVLELARALTAAGHSPRVAAAVLHPDASAQPFQVCAFDVARARASLRPLLDQAEVVVLPQHGLVRLPWLAKAAVPLVFDLYDPIVFELLEAGKERPAAARAHEIRTHTAILNQVLRRGDFFLCASERQRDLWLGALAANGRITPLGPAVARDPELRQLIDVVPFGLHATPPAAGQAGRPTLTAAVPGIRTAEMVIAWGGGLWDWLDPFISIRAMALLAARRPGVHLVVFAGLHPTPGQAGTAAAAGARELAARLGIAGRQVHFIDAYVPYAERGRYLSECDAGISTHRRHLESRFAFRTRILDYLWAGLPVVCTAGDVMAGLVEEHGLGIVVPEQDAATLAGAIERLAADPAFAAGCRARIAERRHALTWDLAARALVRFCSAPHARRRDVPRAAGAWALAVSGWRVLTTHGSGEAVRRLRGHLSVRS